MPATVAGHPGPLRRSAFHCLGSRMRWVVLIHLTKAQYWQNQADDDLDAAISYIGSSVMVGDMLAYDFFIDAFNFDLSQSQFFSSRYDNCQNLHQP
jgi:hypothetical protein